MLQVYVNSPASRVTIHHNEACPEIRKMNKPGQRVVRVDSRSLSVELRRFEDGHYRFQATAALNDMWLQIDFADPEYELDVLNRILGHLGPRYKRIRNATPKTHC